MNKHLKLILSLVLVLGGHSIVYAQQEAMYSQYMQNALMYNPAVSSTGDYAQLNLGYRRQWVGLPGSPTSYYASGYMPIDKRYDDYEPLGSITTRKKPKQRQQYITPDYAFRPHHGVGAIVQQDQYGALKNTTVAGVYSLNMPMSSYWRLSIGATGGVQQYSFNNADISLINPFDAAFRDQTPKFNPILTLGAWMYSSSGYIGFSASNLLNGSVAQNAPNTNSNFIYPHYYLTGGLKIMMDEDWMFVPSVMLRLTRPYNPSVDINGKFMYSNLFWAGASYRYEDALSLMFGVSPIENISVSYSYDYTTSALSTISRGSHEIVLGFRAGKYRPKAMCPNTMW